MKTPEQYYFGLDRKLLAGFSLVCGAGNFVLAAMQVYMLAGFPNIEVVIKLRIVAGALMLVISWMFLRQKRPDAIMKMLKLFLVFTMVCYLIALVWLRSAYNSSVVDNVMLTLFAYYVLLPVKNTSVKVICGVAFTVLVIGLAWNLQGSAEHHYSDIIAAVSANTF